MVALAAKEAALDYIADGAWRDAREQAKLGRRVANGNGVNRTQGTGREDPGEGPKEAAEDRAAAVDRTAAEAQVSATVSQTVSATPASANDNAIVRIAQEIRHAVNGWRHGGAVDAFAAERAQVMEAWDDLRQRARADGDAVALSPAFRETLDRHGALMKQAASFRAKPQVFERLLAERAGIGQDEIEEFRKQHARAGKYLRSATARAAHRARQDAERQTRSTKTRSARTHRAKKQRSPRPWHPRPSRPRPGAFPKSAPSLPPRSRRPRTGGRSTGSCSATGTISSHAHKNRTCRCC